MVQTPSKSRLPAVAVAADWAMAGAARAATSATRISGRAILAMSLLPMSSMISAIPTTATLADATSGRGPIGGWAHRQRPPLAAGFVIVRPAGWQGSWGMPDTVALQRFIPPYWPSANAEPTFLDLCRSPSNTLLGWSKGVYEGGCYQGGTQPWARR